MLKSRENYVLKYWPTPQDYNEAVQNPEHNFSDSQLRDGEIFVGPQGLPVPVCGAFASVYRVRSGGEQFAVRCFLREVRDQANRYKLISEFVQNDDLASTVGFHFIDEGVRVNTSWFPILKMQWVDGLTLDRYVMSKLDDSVALNSLAEKFMHLCLDLQRAGIAHGDLQHGNIMVSDGELRLVDYDGMFVPSMAGLEAGELGHRNYQHPQRSRTDFGAYLDNFAAWAIYTSLVALAIDPTLFSTLGAGDDCLLFKEADFRNSRASVVFELLETHENAKIRVLAKTVRWNLSQAVCDVPPLCDELLEREVEPLLEQPQPTGQRSSKIWGRSQRKWLPDWLDEADSEGDIDFETSFYDIEPDAPSGQFVRRASSVISYPPDSVTHPIAGSAQKFPRKLSKQKAFATSRPHTIEHELLQSVPRKVELVYSDFYAEPGVIVAVRAILSVMISIGIIALSLALIPILIFIAFEFAIHREPKRQQKLLMTGEAVIADIFTFGSGEVQYRFQLRDGQEIEHRSKITDAEAAMLVYLGNRLTVLYDPDAPHNSILYSLSRYRVV